MNWKADWSPTGDVTSGGVDIGGLNRALSMVGTCAHILAIASIKEPSMPVCSECARTGSRWVHLRTCQNCGVTLCCDLSPNRHASVHACVSGHPVMASAEWGEHWLYCYRDNQFIEY